VRLSDSKFVEGRKTIISLKLCILPTNLPPFPLWYKWRPHSTHTPPPLGKTLLLKVANSYQTKRRLVAVKLWAPLTSFASYCDCVFDFIISSILLFLLLSFILFVLRFFCRFHVVSLSSTPLCVYNNIINLKLLSYGVRHVAVRSDSETTRVSVIRPPREPKSFGHNVKF
jgi:hypothetical protein